MEGPVVTAPHTRGGLELSKGCRSAYPLSHCLQELCCRFHVEAAALEVHRAEGHDLAATSGSIVD